jgi:hypothetical protein
MHPELERVLGTVPDSDLTELDLDEVRSRRATVVALEDSISYVRRIIQVRLDILGTELAHRRSGDAPASSSDLVARLPEILAEHSGAAGPGQAPRDLSFPEVDSALVGVVDGVISTARLAEVGEIDDGALGVLVDSLEILEGEVSSTRRVLHERLDALQGEIVRRYRTGEASVDSLLE